MSDSSAKAALVIVYALQEQAFRFAAVSEPAKTRNVTLVPGEKHARFEKINTEEVE